MGRRRETRQWHFHVGLSGGKPYITDQEIRAVEVRTAANCESEWTPRCLRHEPCFPLPQPVRGRGVRLGVESDGELFVWRRLAPQMDGGIALQYCMVGNDAGKPEFSPSG